MISAEEFERIAQFRSIIPTDLLSKERFQDDYYLVRWLRARNMNLDKALEMLKKSMKWRAEIGADDPTLSFEDVVPLKYRKNCPTGVIGRDNEDSIVLLLPFGRFIPSYRILLENDGTEVALKYNMLWIEMLMRRVKEAEEETGRKGLRIVEVVDMEYYSFKELLYSSLRAFLLNASKDFDENYPEMLKSIVIINAPKIFTILFNLIKTCLSEETLAKVSIYGGGSSQDQECWKEVIRSRFDPKRVPQRWGGVRQGKDEFCSDDQQVWIDGPIALEFFTQSKSSELEGFTKERVPARNKFQVDIPVNSTQSGDMKLSWKYKVDSHDIIFSVQFYDNNEQVIIIHPETRTDSKQGVQEGEYHTKRRNGSFILIFDNKYSFTRAKTIYYVFELEQIPEAEQ